MPGAPAWFLEHGDIKRKPAVCGKAVSGRIAAGLGDSGGSWEKICGS